jgi:hypothetical protein
MTPAVRSVEARASLVVRCWFVVGCATTAACSAPSSGSQVTEEGPGPLVAPKRAASEAPVKSPDFISCALDSDCVAVPESGCCRGAWVSVNRGRAADYASAGCTDRTPTCPQIILIGPRVPECDNATHTCTMMAVSSIACGGFVRNAHHCPEDYLCEHQNRIVDIPGVCVSVADSPAPPAPSRAGLAPD